MVLCSAQQRKKVGDIVWSLLKSQDLFYSGRFFDASNKK